MKHIELPIWNKCNNGCVMCTNTDEMRGFINFTFDGIINYLRQKAGKDKPESISLTGGETTISPFFFDIVAYIRKNFPDAELRILSNGRLLAYDSFCKKFLSIGPLSIAIPIHGHNEKIHDGITQIPGSFAQTVAGLKKILIKRRMNQQIEIRIIASRFNLENLPDTVKFISKEFPGANRVVLIFPELEGVAKKRKKEVAISYSEILPILLKINRYAKKIKDFRLYHFPLCLVSQDLWPYVWRTLPPEEVTFLKECETCALKTSCLGVHKSYLSYEKKPPIKPFKDINKVKIKYSGYYHHPILSVKRSKTSKIDKTNKL